MPMRRFSRAHFLISAAAPQQFPPDVGSEVAFVGRSNAGKSSAINAITHRHGLARTSKTPGRTQLLNFFELAPAERLVDLPGYGYADVPAARRRTWPPLIEALRTRGSLRGLFVIVDSRRGLREGDEALLGWAMPVQHIHVLLSKADKLNRAEAADALKQAVAVLAGRASVQLFSALKGTGVRQAEDTLEGWLAQKGASIKNPGDWEAAGAD
jgi:GTP-binding protein